MLVEAGGRVVADVNAQAGEALAAELGAVASASVQTDVTDADSAKAAIDTAVQRFRRPSMVWSAARCGASRKGGGREAASARELARTVSINLIGTFNIVAPRRRRHEQGRAQRRRRAWRDREYPSVAASTARSDRSATLPRPRLAWSDLRCRWRARLSRFGIRVMAIAPGIMETPMLMGMPQEVQDLLGKMVPLSPRVSASLPSSPRWCATSSRTPT